MKIIAELCQNHNGDFDNVRRMVDAAAEGGASHVKIQHIYARNLVYRPQFEHGLVVDGETRSICRPWQTEYDRLKDLELSSEECSKFVDLANSVGLVPMTTCFTRGDAKRISEQGFKVIKVASYDCASFPLLRELGERFDHVIASTGATFDDEIEHASTTLRECNATYSFLHCVTMYPTPLEAMNLRRLRWLKRWAPEVGFSDHSLVERDGVIAAKAAIACGAELIERHFTIADASSTKDGPVSISTGDIRALCDFSKLSLDDQLEHLREARDDWEIMLGDSERWLTKEELLNRDYYRGRFATPRREDDFGFCEMVMNWEETPL